MYRLYFSPRAKEDLLNLDKNIAQRVLNKLKWLIENIETISHIPLSEKFSGLYKLRVGDWRVIYEIKHDEMIVIVHKIGHRSKIYKL